MSKSATKMKMPEASQRETTLRLLNYLKPYRSALFTAILTTSFSTLMRVLLPVSMGRILNYIQSTFIGNETFDSSVFWEWMLILLGLNVALGISDMFKERNLVYLSQTLVFNLREDVSEKIPKVPLRYFDQQSTGDLISRMTNDVEKIGRNIQISISQLFDSVLLVTGMLVMMFWVSWEMAVVFFITVPLYFISARLITKHSRQYYTQRSRKTGAMVGYVEENFTGTDLIKAFGFEEQSGRDFSEINTELYDASWRASFLTGVLLPIMTFIGNISYILISVAGAFLVIAGRIMIGDVLVFIQYAQNIRRPLEVIADMANTLQETLASTYRVFEFLDAPEEVEIVTDRIESPINKINFNAVDFGYDKDQPVIQGLNLEVDRNETIAIVGHTGAGKSTLINLLLRYYDVDSGTIKINDVNINDVTRDNLRSFFGVVLQDPWLIQGTITDNIRYGKVDATDEEVIEAAKQAQAHHFIHALPEGYNTQINEEGTNISQGQRQLITIARAFVSDPEILVLDEATSSVDTRTEQLIQRGMANLMEGRTNFVIAHRLSTIVDADTILVMDQGSIVEQGNHHELMALKGTYAELFESQFKD